MMMGNVEEEEVGRPLRVHDQHLRNIDMASGSRQRCS